MAFSNLFISAIGAALAAILCLPEAQIALSRIENIPSLFIAVGGLIGTMLALVLSISIIPIQAAAENFTPTIIHIYREDKPTRWIFFTLSALCLGSFLFPYSEVISIQETTLVPVAILFVALSLDLLKWYHRHITNLIGSNVGIYKITEVAKKSIVRNQKWISILARLKLIFMRKQLERVPTNAIEQVLYKGLYSTISPLKSWINEIAEIAQRAVAKQQIDRTRIAINSLCDIACHLLTIRKGNLRIYGETSVLGMASGSDVEDILSPIYEHYKDITRSAIGLKAETTVIDVIKALGAIANHLSNLKASAYPQYSAPITYLPIGYLTACIESAQREGLDDVAIQGNTVLLNISKSAPKNIRIADVHLNVINDLHKIASMFFTIQSKEALANRSIISMMEVGHHLLEQQHIETDRAIDNILDKLLSSFSSITLTARMVPSVFFGQPLAPAYDLTQEFSIGYLIAKATKTIKKDEKNEYANPYSFFIEINERVTSHFYSVGEKIDFGSNFLIWHVLHTIKHISKIFMNLFSKPITDNPDHLKSLEECYRRYLSFFWLAFSKKREVDYSFAEEAADISAYIGLYFYELGHPDLTRFCIDNILSIAESYKNSPKEQMSIFNNVDVMMPVWKIRILLESKKDEEFLQKTDVKIKEFCDKFDASSNFIESFEHRKRQLNEELSESLHYSQADEATGVLQKLLKPDTTDIQQS